MICPRVPDCHQPEPVTTEPASHYRLSHMLLALILTVIVACFTSFCFLRLPDGHSVAEVYLEELAREGNVLNALARTASRIASPQP